MEVAMKLFAVGLVSCVSMSDAWKWAIAFSLGMAVLIGVAQPYMQPQALRRCDSHRGTWVTLKDGLGQVPVE